MWWQQKVLLPVKKVFLKPFDFTVLLLDLHCSKPSPYLETLWEHSLAWHAPLAPHYFWNTPFMNLTITRSKKIINRSLVLSAHTFSAAETSTLWQSSRSLLWLLSAYITCKSMIIMKDIITYLIILIDFFRFLLPGFFHFNIFRLINWFLVFVCCWFDMLLLLAWFPFWVRWGVWWAIAVIITGALIWNRLLLFALALDLRFCTCGFFCCCSLLWSWGLYLGHGWSLQPVTNAP